MLPAKFAKLFTYVSLFSALLCPALLAQAQQDPDAFDKGLVPFMAYGSSSFDSVNANSGNLMLHIPLFSYPQRGTLPNFEIYVTNNSWSWFEKKNCSPTPCDKFVPTGPWGVPVVRYSPSFQIKVYTWKDQFNEQLSHVSHAIDASGAHHILGSVGTSLSAQYRSTDSTGLYYDGPHGILTDHQGIKYQIPCNQVCWATQLTDPSGNSITASTSGNTITGWSDSIG